MGDEGMIGKAKRRRWRALAADRRAGTAIEYGLILSLVVLTMLASLIEVANVTTTLWNNLNTKVTAAR